MLPSLPIILLLYGKLKKITNGDILKFQHGYPGSINMDTPDQSTWIARINQHGYPGSINMDTPDQ